MVGVTTPSAYTDRELLGDALQQRRRRYRCPVAAADAFSRQVAAYSAVSSSTASINRSRMSGMALATRDQLGMKGRSIGRSRNASPAFMMFSANSSTACSSPCTIVVQAVHDRIVVVGLDEIQGNAVVARLEGAEALGAEDHAARRELAEQRLADIDGHARQPRRRIVRRQAAGACDRSCPQYPPGTAGCSSSCGTFPTARRSPGPSHWGCAGPSAHRAGKRTLPARG
jgi:hypothetical protein